jgi:hypothetical protein
LNNHEEPALWTVRRTEGFPPQNRSNQGEQFVPRDLDAHLNSTEIDDLVDFPKGHPELADQGSSNFVEEAERHLQVCAKCQESVQMRLAAGESLKLLIASRHPSQILGCPTEENIQRLAAGISPPSDSETLLRHVTDCDSCGLLFRRYIEAFSDEITPEEERALGTLASSTDVWQRDLASKLSTPSPGPEVRERKHWWRPKLWPVPLYAAAALLLIGIGVGIYVRRTRSPEDLIGVAYSQQRTLELRVASAKYGPIRVSRDGQRRSRLSRPSTLIQAEALLAMRLKEKPDDPRALAAMARIRLLEWDYGAAVTDLTRTLAINSDDLDVKIDLATAYFESGEINGRQSDYLQAVSLLNAVLAKDSRNPVAIFNKAIVLERIGQRKEAAAEWREYLKVDSSSAWAEEARNRLRDLAVKHD